MVILPVMLLMFNRHTVQANNQCYEKIYEVVRPDVYDYEMKTWRIFAASIYLLAIVIQVII